MSRIDTLIICDGGRKDSFGFDAAYIKIKGVPIIGYAISAALDSKYIKKIYIYSDVGMKAHWAAREINKSNIKVKILYPEDPAPMLTPGTKFIRIVGAEQKLVMSISKTFYKYVVNDISHVTPFTGDWGSAESIRKYQVENPQIRELPVVFMGNDQPMCRAEDLDDIISAYNSEIHDTMIGYTKKERVVQYFEAHKMGIDSFHYTLRKNDFINGQWMRHNCLYVSKWGKMDRRLVNVISFYNQHRIQSKLLNFVSVFLKVISEYRNCGPEIIRVLLIGMLFGVGKYFNHFHSSRIQKLVANFLNNQKIPYFTHRLSGHKVSVFDNSSVMPLIDIDDPGDIKPVAYLLEKDKC